jgi:hypothetical protein
MKRFRHVRDQIADTIMSVRAHVLGVVQHDAGVVGPQVPEQHTGERDHGRGSEREQSRLAHPAPAAPPRRRRRRGAPALPDDRADGRGRGGCDDADAEEALPHPMDHADAFDR